MKKKMVEIGKVVLETAKKIVANSRSVEPAVFFASSDEDVGIIMLPHDPEKFKDCLTTIVTEFPQTNAIALLFEAYYAVLPIDNVLVKPSYLPNRKEGIIFAGMTKNLEKFMLSVDVYREGDNIRFGEILVRDSEFISRFFEGVEGLWRK